MGTDAAGNYSQLHLQLFIAAVAVKVGYAFRSKKYAGRELLRRYSG
jgi:hypothetical protein